MCKDPTNFERYSYHMTIIRNNYHDETQLDTNPNTTLAPTLPWTTWNPFHLQPSLRLPDVHFLISLFTMQSTQ